jgi:hypothetical protein
MLPPPLRELGSDAHHLKLQRLQNNVLRTIRGFPRCTPVSDLHTAFSLLYVYDYITIVQATSRCHTNS